MTSTDVIFDEDVMARKMWEQRMKHLEKLKAVYVRLGAKTDQD